MEFHESPGARRLLGREPSEGAPCAYLSNRAFTVNIRKAQPTCTHPGSLFRRVHPHNPWLIHVRVVEAGTGLGRWRPDDLDRLPRHVAQTSSHGDVADQAVRATARRLSLPGAAEAIAYRVAVLASVTVVSSMGTTALATQGYAMQIMNVIVLSTVALPVR